MTASAAAHPLVRVPGPLRAYTEGRGELAVEGATVREVLAGLVGEHTGLDGRILDERGELRRFVNVFVGERNVRQLSGLDTPVGPGDVLSILPAVAGGAPGR